MNETRRLSEAEMVGFNLLVEKGRVIINLVSVLEADAVARILDPERTQRARDEQARINAALEAYLRLVGVNPETERVMQDGEVVSTAPTGIDARAAQVEATRAALAGQPPVVHPPDPDLQTFELPKPVPSAASSNHHDPPAEGE